MKKLILIGCALALTACGGGGGGESNEISARSAGVEGFWTGPASTGNFVDALILENGETWGVYTQGNVIQGALYGSANITSPNTIRLSGTDFNFVSNSSVPGVFSGTFSSKSKIDVSSVQGSSVNLTYNSAYDIPASAASLGGSFSFTGRSGLYSLTPGTVAINSSGAFALTQTNCNSTGSIVPRPNGKNVFDVSISSSGTGCAAGYATLKGVGYLNTSVTPNTFLILALKQDKSDGLIILGTKL